MSFNHYQSPNQDIASYELPQLPPWRTPKIKTINHETTPLRRGPYHLSSPFREPRITTPVIKHKYNYRIFTNKELIQQSKIDHFLQAEITARTLVFHKDDKAHINFESDLQLNCFDSSDEETNIKPKKLYKQKLENPLVDSLPCYKPDELYESRRLSKNHINEDFLENEILYVKRYWNWSALSQELSPKEYHSMYQFLLNEEQLIEQCKQMIQEERGYSKCTTDEEEGIYNHLKEYCHRVYETDELTGK